MTPEQEARVLRLVARLAAESPKPADLALLDRALDRLEQTIARAKDARGHEHVDSGEHGGEFTSYGGTSGQGKHAAKRQRRKKRQGKKPRKKQATATGGKKAVDTRVKIQKKAKGSKDAGRADRASASYEARKSNRDVQRYGEAQESALLSKMGGTQGSNNGAIDIVRKVGGVEHGLEVKTLINKGGPNKSGEKAQIKMEADQLARKATWKAGAPNRQSGVIVLDHRDRATSESGEFIGNKEAWSGHELYYRRDYGAHRIGGMYKARSVAEIKTLMGKSDAELRSMVAADPVRWKGVIGKGK